MKKGLQPLIDKFLRHGLLVPCQSPCNSLILPVVKPNGLLRMVQDLRVVNAVVPIHSLMANPYSILTQIPEDTKWFTLLNLKGVFFCIQLHFLSQCLFAFEWINPNLGQMQQYTWTVLPQSFWDCPTLVNPGPRKGTKWNTPKIKSYSTVYRWYFNI